MPKKIVPENICLSNSNGIDLSVDEWDAAHLALTIHDKPKRFDDKRDGLTFYLNQADTEKLRDFLTWQLKSFNK